MSEGTVQQQDLEFRRRLLRQAAEQVRAIELGETWPVGSFDLGRPTPKSAPSNPTLSARSGPPGSVGDLARRYRSGAVSPVEITAGALAEAEAKQPTINAFIRLLPEQALDAARASEARFQQGAPLSLLDGVPIAIKDLVHIAGVRTTAGSRVLADFVAPQDAAVITRLRAAGAIVIGKANLHEFAYGGTGDVSFVGPARNPLNPEHMTGGSSSGSAAAVAAGICPIAIGTDTACSIRTPAAICGIVGLKATYSRVDSTGVIPLSWSQDHVGPMADTVEDSALLLAAISDFVVPDLDAAQGRLTVGLCREIFFQHMDPEVRTLVDRAIGLLGATREVTVPHIGVAGAAQALITSSEAVAFHRHWIDTRLDDYDWSIRKRLESGLDVAGSDYAYALRLRGLITHEMRQAFEGIDILAMPTVPITAPKFGQREVVLEDGATEAVGPLMLRNASPMNVSGFPAITIPCGKTSAGFPVGLQLVALPWQEGRLLQIAHALEPQLAL